MDSEFKRGDRIYAATAIERAGVEPVEPDTHGTVIGDQERHKHNNNDCMVQFDYIELPVPCNSKDLGALSPVPAINRTPVTERVNIDVAIVSSVAEIKRLLNAGWKIETAELTDGGVRALMTGPELPKDIAEPKSDTQARFETALNEMKADINENPAPPEKNHSEDIVISAEQRQKLMTMSPKELFYATRDLPRGVYLALANERRRATQQQLFSRIQSIMRGHKNAKSTKSTCLPEYTVSVGTG